MFNCQMCGKKVPPGIKCVEVVVEKRNKEYPYRENVNRMATWKKEKFDRIASTNDYGGQGYEAAVVKKVCPFCAKSWRAAEQFSATTKVQVA